MACIGKKKRRKKNEAEPKRILRLHPPFRRLPPPPPPRWRSPSGVFLSLVLFPPPPRPPPAERPTWSFMPSTKAGPIFSTPSTSKCFETTPIDVDFPICRHPFPRLSGVSFPFPKPTRHENCTRLLLMSRFMGVCSGVRWICVGWWGRRRGRVLRPSGKHCGRWSGHVSNGKNGRLVCEWPHRGRMAARHGRLSFPLPPRLMSGPPHGEGEGRRPSPSPPSPKTKTTPWPSPPADAIAGCPPTPTRRRRRSGPFDRPPPFDCRWGQASVHRSSAAIEVERRRRRSGPKGR